MTTAGRPTGRIILALDVGTTGVEAVAFDQLPPVVATTATLALAAAPRNESRCQPAYPWWPAPPTDRSATWAPVPSRPTQHVRQ
jgi:hypothetical protein